MFSDFPDLDNPFSVASHFRHDSLPLQPVNFLMPRGTSSPSKKSPNSSPEKKPSPSKSTSKVDTKARKALPFSLGEDDGKQEHELFSVRGCEAGKSFWVKSRAPIPDAARELDKENAEAWIAQHEQRYHEPLTILISKIEHVPFSVFKENLKIATQSFLSQVGITGTGDLKYTQLLAKTIVLVEPNKSNLWVAELAREILGFIPAAYYSLGIKKARDFTAHISAMGTKDKAEKTSFKGTTLVLFDDGSYSGRQLKEHLEGLRTVKQEIDYSRVAVIVPYITDHAKTLLTNFATSSHGGVIIATSQKINTVAQSLTPTKSALLRELWWEKEGLEPKTLNFEEMKAPSKQLKELHKMAKDAKSPKNVKGTKAKEAAKSQTGAKVTQVAHPKAQTVSKPYPNTKHPMSSKPSKEIFDNGPETRGVVWFDHKIPNSQSFPEPIAEGNVVNREKPCKKPFAILPEVHPPYKGNENSTDQVN